MSVSTEKIFNADKFAIKEISREHYSVEVLPSEFLFSEVSQQEANASFTKEEIGRLHNLFVPPDNHRPYSNSNENSLLLPIVAFVKVNYTFFLFFPIFFIYIFI
jgi:hypothetical protein